MRRRTRCIGRSDLVGYESSLGDLRGVVEQADADDVDDDHGWTSATRDGDGSGIQEGRVAGWSDGVVKPKCLRQRTMTCLLK